MVKQSCEEIGRDPATLETSMLVMAVIDENATADLIPDDFKQRVVFGGAEQIAEQIETKVLDAGVDGVILSPITSIDGYHPGGITAVGESVETTSRRVIPPLDVGNNTAQTMRLSEVQAATVMGRKCT